MIRRVTGRVLHTCRVIRALPGVLAEMARAWVMTHVVAPPRDWIRTNWRSYALVVGFSLLAAALLGLISTVLAAYVIFGSTPTFSVSYGVHFGFWPGVAAPTASIPLLTGFKRTLVDMQEYRAVLEITMPETHRNLQLGTFSVSAALLGQQSGLALYSTIFSTAMPHRSWAARTSDGILRIVPQLLGFGLVKHKLSLELFPSIIEFSQDPFGTLLMNISSNNIELYDAKLVITATMSRIAFAVKYHWIASSFAALCVTSAMFCSAFAAFWIGSWIYMIVTAIINHFNGGADGRVEEHPPIDDASSSSSSASSASVSSSAPTTTTTTTTAQTTTITEESGKPTAIIERTSDALDEHVDHDEAGTSSATAATSTDDDQQTALSELRKRR